ncbi:MAG TPA: thioredoxin domain-containing protein [Taishania sp.]|nr:thioredoxin domain-containing protein [Taishania sp.]
MRKISILLIFILAITNIVSAQKTVLNPVEFSTMMGEVKEYFLIDVRTSGEFADGHIQGATNVDWNGTDFDEKMQLIDKNAPIFIYCLGGGRSSMAAEKLISNGYSNIIELNGGMMAWRKNNMPEIKNATTSNKDELTIEKYIELIQSDKLVLVDFYAKWCLPCKKMEPYLNTIASDLKDVVEVVRIDVDANKELCKQLNIVGLPVLRLYSKNEQIWEQTGYVEENIVREKILKNHQ